VNRYPDSPHAEQDAYQIASLTAALRKAGVQKDNEIRAIQAYQSFVENYPKSELVGRARMNIGAILFERAKSGRETYENAYAVMAELVSATDVVMGDYERGRTLLMMGEIQQDHWHNYKASLDLLSRIPMTEQQDASTKMAACYLKGECYWKLSDYAKAVECYDFLLRSYPNQKCFGDEDIHPTALAAMGECQMKMGDWDGAYKTFMQMKTDWPDDTRTRASEWMLNECIEKRGER